MKKLIVLTLFVSLIISAAAQQTSEKLNISVNYLLYLPQGYDKDTTSRWPLMMFLHGSGERGSDIEKVKVHGPAKLIAEGRQYPFIVVSPQAPANEGWEPEILLRLLKDLKTKYRVDRDRVYLTGLSMGGFGTWALAMKHPDQFAAIIPICGGGDTTDISKLQRMPVWCFHGGKDKVVLPAESEKMINALRRYNPAARLTIYPEAGHDSWTQAYNSDSLYSWMLNQKRYHPEKISVSPETLKAYEGGYAEKNKDTLDLVVTEGKLVVKQQPAMELKPTSPDHFFLEEGDSEIELRFGRNKKGKIDRIIVSGRTEAVLYKVR